MKKIKSIIVDDEQSGRNSLKIWIEKYCLELEIVALAEDIVEAKKLIDKLKPQLVFLDIEMPRGNAFDLLEQYADPSFEVIFVTAFSQYAVQALNMSAAHYILKPVSIEELQVAVTKAIKRISEKSSFKNTSILIENLKTFNSQKSKLVIPMLDGFEVVRLSAILYMASDDNFVHITTADGKSYMACRTMKHYEDQLKDYGFLRIHRKHLINLEHVIKYNKGKHPLVTMVNKKQLEISQSNKKTFLDSFSR